MCTSLRKKNDAEKTIQKNSLHITYLHTKQVFNKELT